MDAQAQIIISLVVGYGVAWGKSAKRFPDPVVYIFAAIAGAAIYYLAMPEGTVIHNWRVVVWQYVAFLLSARGVAGGAVEAKIAPAKDSL